MGTGSGEQAMKMNRQSIYGNRLLIIISTRKKGTLPSLPTH